MQWASEYRFAKAEHSERHEVIFQLSPYLLLSGLFIGLPLAVGIATHPQALTDDFPALPLTAASVVAHFARCRWSRRLTVRRSDVRRRIQLSPEWLPAAHHAVAVTFIVGRPGGLAMARSRTWSRSRR